MGKGSPNRCCYRLPAKSLRGYSVPEGRAIVNKADRRTVHIVQKALRLFDQEIAAGMRR